VNFLVKLSEVLAALSIAVLFAVGSVWIYKHLEEKPVPEDDYIGRYFCGEPEGRVTPERKRKLEAGEVRGKHERPAGRRGS
jgi:hypothetical protein